MDVSNTRQQYKHYASLCLSVMGQRRFRISMGALIASPEGGDASVNVIPQMKKCSIISADHSKSFVSTMSEKNSINQNLLMPASNYSYVNGTNRNEYEQMLFMESSLFDEMNSSNIYDNCQFPYYRSSKNNGQSADAVLVKDVGVSCMLLTEDIPNVSIPEESSNLVKQLKREYHDLSNITSKITAYTKDILNHLSKKNQRKSQLLQNLISRKHVTASEYINSKGNLCLKLRLFSNAQTQCTPLEIVKESNCILLQDSHIARKQRSRDSKNRVTCKDQMTICEEIVRSRHEKQVQTIFSEENVKASTSNSLSCSTSSIYNYLMLKKKRSSNEMLKSTFIKFSDMDKRHSNNDKDNLKRCNPVIFTNWKEISKSKRCKNKTLSIIPSGTRTTNFKQQNFLQKQFPDCDMTSDVPDTRFHTVNIRLIKRNNKNV
ncbi:uncharacterized protein LOC143188126 [Calliopsis andreniformis]|uniref:uncharacterized protein LOC143188126 n=1 Tax=Calliopsis andreniformis TaxID=337506 RepID=UPI003FCCCFC5